MPTITRASNVYPVSSARQPEQTCIALLASASLCRDLEGKLIRLQQVDGDIAVQYKASNSPTAMLFPSSDGPLEREMRQVAFGGAPVATGALRCSLLVRVFVWVQGTSLT
jgi:hypothetical protein